MKKVVRPSDLETQVLSVLWKKGPMSVRDVMAALPDGKKRAYTTVLTVLQVMEKKGLLDHKQDGLAHIYFPKVKQREVLRPMMRDLLQNVFGGQASMAVQHLLAEANVDAEELEQLRKLIQQYDTNSNMNTNTNAKGGQ
ncbi:MAG: BlaI/MecI/CopY family transcriptional regulator [Phycisphaerae bacterium]|nr:BlaI/MecI/CopY family transcriptional regulator [Phycisphaerae bacterium]